MRLVEAPPGPLRRIRTRISVLVRLGLVRAERSSRRVLIGAGFPLKRQVLLLPCASGPLASGFFSEFCAVLGVLDHYENWKGIYEGLRVDFGVDGLYYDASRGANWWEYYFEPIRLGGSGGAPIKRVSHLQHDRFAERVEEALPRSRSADLVGRYVRVKPQIVDAVGRFAAAHFTGAFVVGVHYRGTDKRAETPRVPYDRVLDAAAEAVARQRPGACKVFVATDEQAFLEAAARAFPGMVASVDALRSHDGSPVHERAGDNYRKGADALVDCLLLARCDVLIRTPSNLSLCAGFFNPELPVSLVESVA